MSVQAENRISEGSILIVEDSNFDAAVVARSVEKATGTKPLFAKDGEEALVVLSRERISLVLTDMNMPKLNGLKLVEKVVCHYPGLPIVLMTSQGSEEIACEAIRLGASSYVPKISLGEQLPAILAQLLFISQTERKRAAFLEGMTSLDAKILFPNDETLVPVFIQYIQQYLAALSICEPTRRVRVGVALEEALLNAMYHGNLEVSSQLKEHGNAFNLKVRERQQLSPYKERKVTVEYRLTRDECRFKISDEGPGFDISSLPDPTDPENFLKPSGRGLLLIHAFVDEVSLNAKGNEITLAVRRKS
jgi:CheY-like chemotaxis protein